jgi:hypothetical protein
MPGKTKKELKELVSEPEVNVTGDIVNQYPEVQKYVSARVAAMKEWRKSLGVEKEWKEADAEYLPTDLSTGTGRKRFETDDELGLRARLVPVTSEDEWRSKNSDPTLLTKIQTALSILVDNNPQATLEALVKKYDASAAVTKALWKRNWNVTGAKDKLKLFVFNLAKYGWSAGRTYPRRVEQDKKILTKYYADNPEKNEYESKKLLWFNDLDRETLDPFRTWIDEMTKPYDQFSMNDCYYEVDYGYDQAKLEFGMYDNWSEVKAMPAGTSDEQSDSSAKENAEKKSVVTLGFFESRSRDLFAIVVPRQSNLVLYYSPLPNDDGMLSVWHTPWILRSASSPYGVSLWRIIKQDKELYDKMTNMTMDQLVLSILKMFFYTGSSGLLGDGTIKISPGAGKQIINGKVDWMDIPGPGAESWKGLAELKNRIDNNSGVTPTLEGEVAQNKTLGEVLHAKESALKRMRMPLENIVWAIEQDAYVSISWFPQLYSVPEVMQFARMEDIAKYEQENQMSAKSKFQKLDEFGNQEGNVEATFLPQMKLGLEKRGSTFIESKQDRFFQIGDDLPLDTLRWRGMFRVIPKSIVSSSSELDKQRKLEIFNLLVPLLSLPPELGARPAAQILKANDEEPEDWLPDAWVEFLKGASAQPQGQPLFVPQPGMQAPGMGMGMESGGQSMQGLLNVKPNQGGPTVVPRSQLQTPSVPGINANAGSYFGQGK